MENTFKLTDEHTALLGTMNEEIKQALVHVVNTLGYYSSIQFFTAEFDLPESKAKCLADLGCYVID
jgi:hypothetical protein